VALACVATDISKYKNKNKEKYLLMYGYNTHAKIVCKADGIRASG
jgi:hypothetical protein